MYKMSNELKSKVLKRSLSAYIVPPFVNKYNVVAVRALWREKRDKEKSIWAKRRQLECILNEQKEVVSFFSCITGLYKKAQKKRKR